MYYSKGEPGYLAYHFQCKADISLCDKYWTLRNYLEQHEDAAKFKFNIIRLNFLNKEHFKTSVTFLEIEVAL